MHILYICHCNTRWLITIDKVGIDKTKGICVGTTCVYMETDISVCAQWNDIIQNQQDKWFKDTHRKYDILVLPVW